MRGRTGRVALWVAAQIQFVGTRPKNGRWTCAILALFYVKLKPGVEIAGLEHIEYLPIMDYKNKSISLENITSFDVNKSIQRSLTKALARQGLGLYLYAGEDLPEIEVEKISAKDAKILQNVVKKLWWAR